MDIYMHCTSGDEHRALAEAATVTVLRSLGRRRLVAECACGALASDVLRMERADHNVIYQGIHPVKEIIDVTDAEEVEDDAILAYLQARNGLVDLINQHGVTVG